MSHLACGLSRKAFSLLQVMDEVRKTKTWFQNELEMCFTILS